MMTDDEILAKIEETTLEAPRYQLQTLRSILEHNAGVSYLQPYLKDYPAPVDEATFRREVPLSCYDDYAEHIRRMADGDLDDNDPRILSVDPLVCFFYSSGTSSMKPKMIPYFDSAPSKGVSYLAHQGSAAIIHKLFPTRPSINKILWFVYGGNVTETKGGFKAMAASSFPLHNKNSDRSQFLSLGVSPKEVVLGSNLSQQMYCHLLCGLRLFNLVDGIGAPYASGLFTAISLLQSRWEQLCDDLECGFPTQEISDDSMRDSVAKVLGGPQMELGNRVRSICQEKSWDGILSKLWPNARYVRCVTTGTMEQYYSKIKFYAGELTLLGGDYFASECCVGINLDILQDPGTTRFTILPNAAYFEFLPFDMDSMRAQDDGETVDLGGVEVGKMYEVVVTTYRGLYRYCLGDIVEVVGFHNSSPQLKFVTRAPKFPHEIITERDVMSAMKCFQEELGSGTSYEITEFACHLDAGLSPTTMKVFIEAAEGSIFFKPGGSAEVLRRCGSSFVDGLGAVYKQLRGRGSECVTLLCIVKPGGFDEVLRLAVENGAPASQYKPPKIIRNAKVVELLEKSTVISVCLDALDG